ncbi:transposase-like protein [Bradyrhizobium sp. GM24.11]
MKRYVYIWADGIHLEARLEDEKQCMLVLIGAMPEGRKELVGFTDGTRESAHDWRDLLLELKAARARRAAAARHRRWRTRVLEGRRRGLAENA